MENELISIIIPAFNAEDSIVQCLESCKKQTYSDIEIIVIDDGSRDNTLNRIRSEAQTDPRITVFHTENMGVCSARNIGIEKSSGKYIMFLDSDDELKENAADVLLERLRNSHADISVGAYETIRKDKVFQHHYECEHCVWDGRTALVEALKDHTATYSVWGKLYSRQMIGETRFEVGRKIHEDSFFFFLLCLKEPRVSVSDESIYIKNEKSDTASNAVFSDKYLDMLYFADEKRKIIESGYPEYNDLINTTILKANLAFLSLCFGNNIKGVKNAEKQCIAEVKKRKQYFISASEYNDKFFRIVNYGLYFPFKFLQRIRSRS